MNGAVDALGRALLTLEIRRDASASSTIIQAWIDTAFNGELVIPRHIIAAANLTQSGGIEARLADGNVVTLESFACHISWFGAERVVEVIANDGEFPLLGIGLLRGRKLFADYELSTLSLD